MWSDEPVPIQSRDYWFIIVEFLQQNWALVDSTDTGVVVWFFGDTAYVFDELKFDSGTEAEAALRRNGFKRFADDTKAHEFIAIPRQPFHRRPHPNGPIYSSGRFWK